MGALSARRSTRAGVQEASPSLPQARAALARTANMSSSKRVVIFIAWLDARAPMRPIASQAAVRASQESSCSSLATSSATPWMSTDAAPEAQTRPSASAAAHLAYSMLYHIHCIVSYYSIS